MPDQKTDDDNKGSFGTVGVTGKVNPRDESAPAFRNPSDDSTDNNKYPGNNPTVVNRDNS